MVSPASTGLIHRNSRKPGDGPPTAIFSPRARASLIRRWPSATRSFMQTDPTCQPEAASPPNSDLRPRLFVEMKGLRIELRRKFLDSVGGEGERPDVAPPPDLDVLEETHQPACPVAIAARRCTMMGETISHNATPAALRTRPLNVTIPVPGRLRETLASATSTSSVRSSPGRSGASQRNSLTPG